MRGERQAQRLFESQPESGKYFDSLVHFPDKFPDQSEQCQRSPKKCLLGKTASPVKGLFFPHWHFLSFGFLDLQFWCQRKVTEVKRVLEPSPNHQIPLKGLRPPRPGVLPFSSTFLDKITSLIIFALTDLAFAKGGLCPSQLCLGCGWQSSIQLSIPVRGGIKSELISSQCGPR